MLVGRLSWLVVVSASLAILACQQVDEEELAAMVQREVEAQIAQLTLPVGPQGVEGPQGDDGLQGAQGPVGSVGPAGLQGVAGPIGPLGPHALIGPSGPAGPKGSVGPGIDTSEPFGVIHAERIVLGSVGDAEYLELDPSGLIIRDENSQVLVGLAASEPGKDFRSGLLLRTGASLIFLGTVPNGDMKLVFTGEEGRRLMGLEASSDARVSLVFRDAKETRRLILTTADDLSTIVLSDAQGLNQTFLGVVGAVGGLTVIDSEDVLRISLKTDEDGLSMLSLFGDTGNSALISNALVFFDEEGEVLEFLGGPKLER